MNPRRWTAIGLVLLSGCVMKRDYDRVCRAVELQTGKVDSLNQQLADREAEISRQAAQELQLRKQIAQLNQRLAALREENRQLQDKIAAADRTSQTSEERVKALQADRTRALAQAKESADQVLAERDAQINRLEEKIRQLEELLARSRIRRDTSSTRPTN